MHHLFCKHVIEVHNIHARKVPKIERIRDRLKGRVIAPLPKQHGLPWTERTSSLFSKDRSMKQGY